MTITTNSGSTTNSAQQVYLSNENLSTTVEIDKYVNKEGLVYFAKKFEEKLLRELSARPTFEYKCNNCGGIVEMDVENHIFKCPYCGSVYAIGTAMVNDEGKEINKIAGF